jgi:hypothetical protein
VSAVTKEKIDKLQAFIDEFGEDFFSARDRVKSALMRATVPEHIAESVGIEAVGHRVAMMNLSVQDDFLSKSIVFSKHAEDVIRLALSRLFYVAENRELAETDKTAEKTQLVVISCLLGHAIEGCFMMSETEEDAKKLFNNLKEIVFKQVMLKMEEQEEGEEETHVTTGSSSIH